MAPIPTRTYALISAGGRGAFGPSFTIPIAHDRLQDRRWNVEPVVEDVTPESNSEAPAVSAEDLAAVRELILLAHPDVVPELVTGTTVAELTASVAAARAAYQGV